MTSSNLVGCSTGISPGFAPRRWQLAAEQGHAGAQNNLGTLYAEGQGVTQHNVSAYLWFSLAAAQGDKGAVNNLDRVARQMSQAQMLEAKKLVSEWQSKKVRLIKSVLSLPQETHCIHDPQQHNQAT